MTLTATHSTQGRPVRSLRYDLAERPYLVIWEVTRACGLVCTHCRADAVRQRNPLELDTAEAHAMLDDIATFGPPRPVVVLTGGDPLERADLVGLVAHGTAAGLSMALSPSVTPLLTRAALIELRAAGAKAVSLSLDGGTAATHDGFRGVAGVFDATLAAARTVREVGFRLQLNTTVTAGNVRELPQILRFVLELEAALWSVFLLVPTGRGAGLPTLLHLRALVDQALRVLKKKMQREGLFREMKLRKNYEKPSEKKAREKAEAQAITVFGDNLVDLLLAAPAGPKAVLGLDPGPVSYTHLTLPTIYSV